MFSYLDRVGLSVLNNCICIYFVPASWRVHHKYRRPQLSERVLFFTPHEAKCFATGTSGLPSYLTLHFFRKERPHCTALRLILSIKTEAIKAPSIYQQILALMQRASMHIVQRVPSLLLFTVSDTRASLRGFQCFIFED
jgi:hypothetical protein